MFRVFEAKETTGPQGFQVKFENGYEVSVMFGNINYCSNRFIANPPNTSNSAELAVFIGVTYETLDISDLCGIDKVDGNSYGWVTPEFVAEVMAKVAALPSL